jgi:uncharacterized protein (DUF2267 family)
MSAEIEFAEVRLNDGDGNDYINFYVDGVTHSYLLEDVYENMQETAQLTALAARLAAAEAEAAKLREDLRKAVIYWDHGSPNFETSAVEFPFEIANEISHFMNDVRRAALQEPK